VSDRATRQREADLAALLKLPEFQRWLGWLLFDHCGLMRYAGTDPHASVWNDGRRSVASDLVSGPLANTLVNVNGSAVTALLGTFCAEQSIARRDREQSAEHAGAAAGIAAGWRRDAWGEPYPLRPGDPDPLDAAE
jgi:hypothetical protein